MRGKINLLSIAVLILFMFILSGCHEYFGNLDWSNTEKAELKQNTGANFGQSAVYLDGRIYYVSQENGSDGLYSMNTDGTDVTYECVLPRITRLIVFQGNIYYVGLKDIEEGQKIFGLYCYDRSTKDTKVVDYCDDYKDEDVKDAYVAGNGLICVTQTIGINTSSPPSDIVFMTDSMVKPSTASIPHTYIESTNIKYDTAKPIDNYVIDRNDDFIVGRDNYLPYDEQEQYYSYGKNNIGNDGCSFYDLKNGIAMDDIKPDDDNYFKVLYADDERILCSFNNELLEIDPETLAVTHDYKFDNTDNGMKIAFMFKAGDTIYAVFERNKSSNKDVYYLNLQTSKNGKISTFNDSKELLGVENGNILWVQGSVIHCSSLGENGIGNDIYSIKMPEDVVSNNIFEIAGDWLFIHRLSTTEETNQLLYKVNLKTQEINKVS